MAKALTQLCYIFRARFIFNNNQLKSLISRFNKKII